MTGADPQGRAIVGAGLTKRFGARLALDRVDLEVREGESVVVFGPNGAGKTTLIRALTLALRLDSGSLRIAGLDPRREDVAIRARTGVISHQSYLYDDLTTSQNLEFYAALYAVAEPRRRARELAALLGLESRLDDRAGDLSRGLQQRLSVARALVHDPPLLFLDEPFTGLDPQAAERLRELIGGLRRRGRTLLLVTHDLRQGLELADRWLLLAQGRVVDQGPTAGTDPERFAAQYAAGAVA